MPPIDGVDVARLLAGEHKEPHRILGAHATTAGGSKGVVVRAYHPDASGVELLLENEAPQQMERLMGGLFAIFLPGASVPLRYRLRYRFPDSAIWERDDPYRFSPTLGDVDLHLFNEGTHRRLWE
jgi:1,4-alpha-glucan branching enzyme